MKTGYKIKHARRFGKYACFIYVCNYEGINKVAHYSHPKYDKKVYENSIGVWKPKK